MAFGVSGGSSATISRNKNFTTEVAYMQDSTGKKIQAHTFGAELEITEEMYETKDNGFTNQATEGQDGTSVCTANSLSESNTDYAKISVTKKILPGDTTYGG